jgi:hydroxybutyrate-dimer hydrolase
MKALLATACLLLSVPIACADEAAPAWLRLGPHTTYDSVTDDLVTGGLGADGMLGKRPGYADPLHPTAAELRRAALFQPGSAGQGFGRLFGPDVDETTGQKIPGEGKVAGDEYLAYADDGDGKQNVAMLLQIPTSLSSGRRCLIAIPVNGSSSLFRDVVDFGYWGLRRGCAVVYTDKGHGNGFDMLEQDSVNGLDGRQVPAAEAGRDAHFRADLDDSARAKFLAEWPHRVAFKAAHSKQNPEKDWGEDLLEAIRFAFHQLGQRDPGFTRDNTLVIATGSSNGGGAVLYAAERDAATGAHLIDGVVAREPQVQLKPDDRVVVARGLIERRGSGRTLLDYFTFGNLYQPCDAGCAGYSAQGPDRLRPQPLRLVARQGPARRRRPRWPGEGIARPDARLRLGRRHRRGPRLRLLRRARRDGDQIRQRPWPVRRTRPAVRLQLRRGRQRRASDRRPSGRARAELRHRTGRRAGRQYRRDQ